LAAVLGNRAESLRIEGHTDNVPIHNLRFASNWELSTSRAAELIRVFVGRYQMDPARLPQRVYAEFHPVAPNDSAAGRRSIAAWILCAQSAAYFCTKFAANREVVSQLETVFDFINISCNLFFFYHFTY